MDRPRHYPHRPQDWIVLARRRCSVFGGTRRVWSIMSYWSYDLAKWLIPNAINNNWSIWTVRCLKNDQNIKRGNTKSFFSMTMLHHICQNQFGARWKHSAGEVLPPAAYSLDLAPSDYHLFASMGYALAEQRFDSYEDVKKWLDEWFAAKGEGFYWRDIHKLPERWEKCN